MCGLRPFSNTRVPTGDAYAYKSLPGPHRSIQWFWMQELHRLDDHAATLLQALFVVKPTDSRVKRFLFPSAIRLEPRRSWNAAFAFTRATLKESSRPRAM